MTSKASFGSNLRLKRLLIFIFLPFLIYCDEENQVELLSDRFQAPSGIVAGCVNVVTGNYFLVETDLYVPGPVPIIYKRFYNSGNLGGGMLDPSCLSSIPGIH
ncbi:putative uncharacterized protein [Waddlia chondrophila 2032/99]|uniref:DUF6531 domain-containing protein n=2 Tax=Waddlia chondrophila TaxID=71667 RepID=D6YVX8_WADCW|nr:DUF6531 domain-containing protein [Waddlia chondrophila]ADI38289.1 hypothetical protein wcw_0928 [Waddlia chondrophila WSU 86-1044]CCB91371.1 putative uncharacterized protein [Waddlia chondrophila 2032/99]